MKKKLTAIVAVLMALSLSACSPDKAKEEGKKIKKDLENKVEDLKDDVSKYVDDETDLEALTGTSTSTFWSICLRAERRFHGVHDLRIRGRLY